MNGFQALAGAAALLALFAIAAASAIASCERSAWAAMDDFAADPWGLALLIDLGASLAFAAAWMVAVERRPTRLLVWLPLLAILGHMATALFLLDRLRRARDPIAWLTQRL